MRIAGFNLPPLTARTRFEYCGVSLSRVRSLERPGLGVQPRAAAWKFLPAANLTATPRANHLRRDAASSFACAIG